MNARSLDRRARGSLRGSIAPSPGSEPSSTCSDGVLNFAKRLLRVVLQPPDRLFDPVEEPPGPGKFFCEDRQAQRNDDNRRAGQDDQRNPQQQDGCADECHRDLSKRGRPRLRQAAVARGGKGRRRPMNTFPNQPLEHDPHLRLSFWEPLHHLAMRSSADPERHARSRPFTPAQSDGRGRHDLCRLVQRAGAVSVEDRAVGLRHGQAHGDDARDHHRPAVRRRRHGRAFRHRTGAQHARDLRKAGREPVDLESDSVRLSAACYGVPMVPASAPPEPGVPASVSGGISSRYP